MAYIKSVDGFTGCFRGLGPKLLASLASGVAYQKVHESIKFEDETESEEDRSNEEEWSVFAFSPFIFSFLDFYLD